MSLRATSLGAVALSALMVITACDGTNGDDENGTIVISTPEPTEPLTPGLADDAGVGIVDQLYAGLTVVGDDGQVAEEVAASVESEDSETWTITVDEGWEFSDGTPVTAQSFVDGWVDAATNGEDDVVRLVFGGVRGIGAIRNDDAESFEGVEVEGDTITVQLAEADPDFPGRLSHRYFFPRAEADLEQQAEAGQAPIGNGPYVVEEGDWDAGASMVLTVNDAYEGARAPSNEGLRFEFHEELDDAFAALEDDDVDLVMGATRPVDSEDGLVAVHEPGPALQSLMIPEWLPRFGGEEGVMRRRAVSLSIDREALVEEVFAGAHTPASDLTTPLLPGFNDELEATEFLEFDPERAAQFWSNANDIEEFEGPLTLGYNGDADHAAWIEPMGEQISEALDIEVDFREFDTFEGVRNAVVDRSEDAAFRIAWQGEYPSALDYLAPRFVTGASSNGGDYSFGGVDNVLREARQADDSEEYDSLIDRAQQRLLSDLPVLPLWYIGVTGVADEDITGVRATWSGSFEFSALTRD